MRLSLHSPHRQPAASHCGHRPGAPASVIAAARAHIATWRYRPAEWAGVHVRQFVNVMLTFDSSMTKRTPFSNAFDRPYYITAPPIYLAHRAEVLASVEIDRTGEADISTIAIMPGMSPDAEALVRSLMRDVHIAEANPFPFPHLPARQRVTRFWFIEPHTDHKGFLAPE